MATHIGLIDDNDDTRDSVKRTLVEELPDGWDVISSPPKPRLSQTLAWVRDSEISVLLLDERLNQTMNVPYSGHEVAAALRQQRPEFPVFVVTAYPNEDDLVGAENHLDGIVSRLSISARPEVYVPRFVRAGVRFIEQHEADLAKLSALSMKIAQGTASAADKRKVAALQAGLQLRFFSQDETTMAAAVDELEATMEQAETLQQQLEEAIRAAEAAKDAKKRTPSSGQKTAKPARGKKAAPKKPNPTR